MLTHTYQRYHKSRGYDNIRVTTTLLLYKEFVNSMEKTAKRVLSAMLYKPSKHGDSFRYSTADDIFDEEVSKHEFSEGGIPNADYTFSAQIEGEENVMVQRNKTLGLFDATVKTMNSASSTGVNFEVKVDEKIIHYIVEF